MSQVEERQLAKIGPLLEGPYIQGTHIHTRNPKTGRSRPCPICKQARLQRAHEREQAVIKGSVEITRETIRATGEAFRGLLQNQIAGTAFFILLATFTYPEWIPIASYATSRIAADIASAVHDNVVPTIENLIPGLGGKPGIVPPPTVIGESHIVFYFYRWTVLGGWGIQNYASESAAVNDWNLFNAIGVAGNLFKVTEQKLSDGQVRRQIEITKYSTFHKDVGPEVPK